MPMQDKPRVIADIKVQLGEIAKNRIRFTIENTGTEPLKDLVARIEIPCGPRAGGACCLLRKVDDDVVFESPLLRGNRNPVGDSLVTWESSSAGFDLTPDQATEITVSGFAARDDGIAPIVVVIAGPWDDPFKGSWQVEIKPAPGVRIIDFRADPAYIRSRDSVKLSGMVANANYCKLTIPGNQIKVDSTHPAYEDHPTVSVNNYRLDAYRSKEDEEHPTTDNHDFRFAAVEVEEPGWHSRALLDTPGVDGAEWLPSVLLPARDLRGGPEERLYGVFIHRAGNSARLFSSSTGLSSWRFEADVPAGMEESPGVICDGKLWLLGGSSVNPEAPKSNRVCCWFKRGDNSMDWKDSESPRERQPQTSGSDSFTPRSCHACAAFNGEIWVLGGIGPNDKALKNIRICSVSQSEAQRKKDEITMTWRDGPAALWSERCLFAAAVSQGQFPEPRLWIYGGTSHPYSIDPINEVYYADAAGWHQLKSLSEKMRPPKAATLLHDGQRLYVVGRFAAKGNENSDRQYVLDSISPFSWSSGDVDLTWRFGQDDMFLIRSVLFAERRMFWPAYYRLGQIDERNRKPRVFVV